MCIYFIQPVNGGLIKIGYADNVWGRFKTIQANSPLDLKILNTIDGASMDREKNIHRYFGKLRVRYEWFSPDKELLDFINNPFEIEYHDAAIVGSNICIGICRDGERCQSQKLNGYDYCYRHQDQVNGLPNDWVFPRYAPIKCKELTRDGIPCEAYAIPGYSYCGPHKMRYIKSLEEQS